MEEVKGGGGTAYPQELFPWLATSQAQPTVSCGAPFCAYKAPLSLRTPPWRSGRSTSGIRCRLHVVRSGGTSIPSSPCRAPSRSALITQYTGGPQRVKRAAGGFIHRMWGFPTCGPRGPLFKLPLSLVEGTNAGGREGGARHTAPLQGRCVPYGRSGIAQHVSAGTQGRVCLRVRPTPAAAALAGTGRGFNVFLRWDPRLSRGSGSYPEAPVRHPA